MNPPATPDGASLASADTPPAFDLGGETWLRIGAVRERLGGLDADTNHGRMRFDALAPGVFRVRAGDAARPDYGLLNLPTQPLSGARCTLADGWVSLAAGDACLRIRVDGAAAFVLELGGRTLCQSPTDAHFTGALRYPWLSRVREGWLVGVDLGPSEPVFGLGERFAGIDVRGSFVDGWVDDALGVNRGASYKQMPFALSAIGWGQLLHTPARVEHAVGYAPWTHRSYLARVHDDALDLLLFAAETPAELVREFTALAGRAPALPEWSLGPWMSRAYYRSADETLAVAREIRRRGMPCTVITLDGRAWLDTQTRFGFTWDAAKIPDPKALTDALHAMDFKVCAWEYPLISERHPLHAHYAERGWLLRAAGSDAPCRYVFDAEPFGSVLTPLPPSGVVDFTHPDAFADWRDRHAQLFDDGIDFIKSDFGEQVMPECVGHNGDAGARLHNAYTVLYNRCVMQATAARTEKPFVLARSAYLGAQALPVHWGGDPQADWGGLVASIRGALSWGLSGGVTYAHDVGGFYADRRDAELFLRWLQAAVFGSHLRFHGVGQREPWTYGEDACAIAMRWLRLREALVPYLAETLHEATGTGLPVMRAMPLACPREPECWRYELQFMCGPSILVAPVVQPGGHVAAWLPRGDWRHAQSGERVSGGRHIERTLPLDQAAVWYREDAALAAAFAQLSA